MCNTDNFRLETLLSSCQDELFCLRAEHLPQLDSDPQPASQPARILFGPEPQHRQAMRVVYNKTCDWLSSLFFPVKTFDELDPIEDRSVPADVHTKAQWHSRPL